MTDSDYPAGAALLMTPAELAVMEREMLHGARSRAASPAAKPALFWTDAEMRAAEQRIRDGRPVSPP